MTETTTKYKNVFIEGAVSPAFIGESIGKHSSKTGIGAHDIFLGQVRNDVIDDGHGEQKEVAAIEYSAYEEMALKEFHRIREAAFEKFELSCLHIYHSLGRVEVGEISLFVFASSMHRKAAMDAVRFLVDNIKREAPVFGKEIFADGTHVWKSNAEMQK
ncbi:MAG: molybdenum cofactor biosynthesis protein MoaE [Bacteroidetes bacterium]|nr:molybdenum cofactor biosynthesis protein MoaE [Bacteroidota bacterium]